jgi:2-polyprenyl-3-methyl-5-hydroxy-6-metoxy-1,4-benzoquinol methylase
MHTGHETEKQHPFKARAEIMHRSDESAPRKDPEQAYHDAYYASRAISDEELIVQAEGFHAFLTRHPIGDLYACLLDNLGDYRGKDILEYGCGSGQVGVFLALKGARVRGFDVSQEGVQLANRRAAVNGVSSAARFESMRAETLLYEDGQFDFVVGRWILHHLDKESLPGCGREIRRVLRKGGKALFIEPLGHNPLIEFVRKHPFYSQGDYESEQESTMKRAEVLAMGETFASALIHEFYLLYMLKRVIRNPRFLGIIKRTDDLLLRLLPFLRRYCGECVIEFVKE